MKNMYDRIFLVVLPVRTQRCLLMQVVVGYSSSSLRLVVTSCCPRAATRVYIVAQRPHKLCGQCRTQESMSVSVLGWYCSTQILQSLCTTPLWTCSCSRLSSKRDACSSGRSTGSHRMSTKAYIQASRWFQCHRWKNIARFDRGLVGASSLAVVFELVMEVFFLCERIARAASTGCWKL